MRNTAQILASSQRNQPINWVLQLDRGGCFSPPKVLVISKMFYHLIMMHVSLESARFTVNVETYHACSAQLNSGLEYLGIG